jgi:hypothetical protein
MTRSLLTITTSRIASTDRGVGGLELLGEARSGNVFVVAPGGFGGWDDGAAMRSETQSRPQSHGDYDMPGFLAGRLMALKGWALADSPEDLEQLRDRFIGHGSDGGKFRVTVERNGRTLYADARLAAGTVPTFEDLGEGLEAEWAVTWWLPDPRKYGDLNTFGPASSVSVFHRGNHPALSALTISGTAGSGYTITGPGGRQIVVTKPLAAGSPHTFDMRTGRLLVGGARQLGVVAKAELFAIPPGLPATTISVNNGATVSVSVPDTFV